MIKNSPMVVRPTFLESLQQLLKLAEETQVISVKTIFDILADKGYAALFMILSLPFCFPIQIPGFSTPFGAILAFLALRYTFAKSLWWPEWILDKEIASPKVSLVVQKTIQAVEYLKKISRPRLTVLTQNTLLHRVHGITIFILSLLLLLPFPIPFTNMLTALPIFCLGVGLLEDDGVFMIVGYILAGICLGIFAMLLFLSQFALHSMGNFF